MAKDKTQSMDTSDARQGEICLLPAGFIYLLHWQDRQGRVEHYVGWTTHLEARLKAHFSTNGGCPTTRKYRQARMGGRLVRLWSGTIWGERKLQQTLDFPQDCPVCRGEVIETIACEGWVEADTSSFESLKSWKRAKLSAPNQGRA